MTKLRVDPSRLTLPLVLAAAALLLSPAANGQAPCCDPSTPPPCAADGACRPKRETWGYYRQSWSRWPGDYDRVIRPTPAAPAEGTVVPPADPPIDPRLEDQASPPPSDAEDDAAADEPVEGEGVGEVELPPLPPLRPGAPPWPGGTRPSDPPPELPRFGPPGGGPGGFSLRPRTPRPARPTVNGRADAPPPLPTDFALLLRPVGQQAAPANAGLAPSRVQQAAYTPEAPHRLPRVAK